MHERQYTELNRLLRQLDLASPVDMSLLCCISVEFRASNTAIYLHKCRHVGATPQLKRLRSRIDQDFTGIPSAPFPGSEFP